MPIIGSSNIVIIATVIDMKSDFLSFSIRRIKCFFSTILMATTTRIAAITDNGKNFNKGKKNRQKTPAEIEEIIPESLLVAPLLMFSVVLANAAVAGIPPISPEPILAMARPRTSRDR